MSLHRGLSRSCCLALLGLTVLLLVATADFKKQGVAYQAIGADPAMTQEQIDAYLGKLNRCASLLTQTMHQMRTEMREAGFDEDSIDMLLRVSNAATMMKCVQMEKTRLFFANLDFESFGEDLAFRMRNADPKIIDAVSTQSNLISKLLELVRAGLTVDKLSPNVPSEVQSIFDNRKLAITTRDLVTISELQIELMKKFFPGDGVGGIDWQAMQQGTEWFNNFDLIDTDLRTARQMMLNNPRETVRGGPDRSGAHAWWYEFATLVLADPQFPPDQKQVWRKMLPILLEGTWITLEVMDAWRSGPPSLVGESQSSEWGRLPGSIKSQGRETWGGRGTSVADIRARIATMTTRAQMDAQFRVLLKLSAKDPANKEGIFLPGY